MPEFGEIFDYQLSTMVFNVVSVGFLAAYAMVAIWAATHADNRVVGKLQAA